MPTIIQLIKSKTLIFSVAVGAIVAVLRVLTTVPLSEK